MKENNKKYRVIAFNYDSRFNGKWNVLGYAPTLQQAQEKVKEFKNDNHVIHIDKKFDSHLYITHSVVKNINPFIN